jgi:hypothetical protein
MSRDLRQYEASISGVSRGRVGRCRAIRGKAKERLRRVEAGETTGVML